MKHVVREDEEGRMESCDIQLSHKDLAVIFDSENSKFHVIAGADMHESILRHAMCGVVLTLADSENAMPFVETMSDIYLSQHEAAGGDRELTEKYHDMAKEENAKDQDAA